MTVSECFEYWLEISRVKVILSANSNVLQLFGCGLDGMLTSVKQHWNVS